MSMSRIRRDRRTTTGDFRVVLPPYLQEQIGNLDTFAKQVFFHDYDPYPGTLVQLEEYSRRGEDMSLYEDLYQWTLDNHGTVFVYEDPTIIERKPQFESLAEFNAYLKTRPPLKSRKPMRGPPQN